MTVEIKRNGQSQGVFCEWTGQARLIRNFEYGTQLKGRFKNNT